MNEHKKHNIILYVTLAIAVLALIVGVVGLFTSDKPDSQTPQSPGSSSGSSQMMPPAGSKIYTVPGQSGSNLNGSGTVNK